MRNQLNRSAILTLLPLLCSAAVTLTDTNGVSAAGKIITYSSNTDLVKIRDDSTTCSFTFSALTPESQKQIELWQADSAFESRSSLDVSFESKNSHSSSNITGTVTDRMTRKETEQTIGYEDRHFCKYRIKVKNESDTPFGELIADYRVFFTQQLTGEYTGKYQLAGSASLDELTPGDSWSFSTTYFLSGITYRAANGINWTGMPQSGQATVQGVILRIRKRGLDGGWLEREIEHGDVPRRRDRKDYQKVYK